MILAGSKDGIANPLGFLSLAKGWGRRLTGFDPLDKVRHLMDKAMFVTNSQTRNPPTPHIGMVAIGNMDGAPSTKWAFILVIEPLQSMEIVKVPCDGAVFTIDLKCVEGLVATGIPGRFKIP